MDFHQFEYVMALEEEKSFSKAAKKLYISQPSLSQYIMRLEKRLGIKLFDRTTNTLTLTFAGETYLESAKNILSLENRLKQELGDIADSKKGRLTIGIPIPTERYILPLLLPEFYKRFPGIEIIIKEHSASDLEELLMAGKVDIAILHLPIKNEEIVFEPLSVERVFLVAPLWYDISHISEVEKQQKFDFSYLKDEKFILLKPGQRMRFIADEIFKRAQFTPNILFEIGNLDTAYRLATAGMGFTLIPENTVRFLNTNQYQNHFLIDDVSFTLALAYRRGEYLTKAAHEFIAIAKQIIGSKHESEISNKKIYHNTVTFNATQNG